MYGTVELQLGGLDVCVRIVMLSSDYLNEAFSTGAKCKRHSLSKNHAIQELTDGRNASGDSAPFLCASMQVHAVYQPILRPLAVLEQGRNLLLTSRRRLLDAHVAAVRLVVRNN